VHPDAAGQAKIATALGVAIRDAVIPEPSTALPLAEVDQAGTYPFRAGGAVEWQIWSEAMRRVAALALALSCLPLAAGCRRPSVLVVALDGGDWDVIMPLLEADHLPTMARLVARGARADLDCVPADPATACFCPPVWTSIVTGQPHEKHGIRLVQDRSSSRAAPALWTVLAEEGRTSTLVSVRATWPPEPEADWVLTEPGLDFAAGEIYDRWPPPSDIRLLDARNRVKPEGLFELLDLLPHDGPRLPAWKSFARDRVAMQALLRLARLQVFTSGRPRFAPSVAAMDPAPDEWPNVGRVERGGDAREPAARRGMPRIKSKTTDLTMITIHSIDKAEHMGWERIQARPGDPIDEEFLLQLAESWSGPVFDPGPWGWGSVASQYLEADAWLGRLLEEVPYDYVVLVSDHGMSRNPLPGPSGAHGIDVPEAHLGIFAMVGPGIRYGSHLGTVSVLDVAPTVAFLLNLPVAVDLPGRVLEEAFFDAFVEARPVREVASWAE
jgi:hypothetical protein